VVAIQKANVAYTVVVLVSDVTGTDCHVTSSGVAGPLTTTSIRC